MTATLEGIASKCDALLNGMDEVKRDVRAINSRVRKTEIEQGRLDERMKQTEEVVKKQGTWDRLLGIFTVALFALASALGIGIER